MKAILPRLILAFGALAFFGIGLWALYSPDAIAESLGMELNTSTAKADVRAVYGGMQIGVGAFLLVCAAPPGGTASGLLAMTAIFLGLFSARLGGLILDGPSGLTFGLLGAEGIGVLAGAAGLWLLRGGGSSD